MDQYIDFTNAKNGGLLVCEDVQGVRGSSFTARILWRSGPVPVPAVNFDLKLPNGVTLGSVTAGPAATSANKQVQGNVVSGNIKIIVFGINQTEIQTGHLATISMFISPTAFPGFQPLDILGFAFSDAQGSAAKGFCLSGGVTIL